MKLHFRSKAWQSAQIRTLINDSGWKDAFIEFRNVDFTQAKVVSGPFVGDFKIDKYGAAELNLYKPTVEAYDAEAVGSKTCYGTLYMDVCGDGSRTETSDIVRAQISTDGCYAKIDYIGGRDGCLYRMVLHYDTTWKNLKVESVDLIDDKDNEHPESYFGVGQVFKRKL